MIQLKHLVEFRNENSYTKRQIESIDASAENYLTKYNDRALPYDLQAIKETCREKNSFNNPEEWTTWDNYWNYRWSCYPESWGNTMRLDPPFQSLNIN